MLAAFCLRLACGLTAGLLLLAPAQVNRRFYRTHFLTAVGLAAVVLVFLWDTNDPWLWLSLWAGLAVSLVASVAWMLEGAPGGRLWIVLATVAFAVALGESTWNAEPEAANTEREARREEPTARSTKPRAQPEKTNALGAARSAQGVCWLLADDFTSAALLGTATTAMLIGHSYLVAPAMSLTPLLTLLGALFVTLGLRAGVAVVGLWYWTGDASSVSLVTGLWLVPRWGLGLVGPLVLGWMAWETAKIRSTQSATGILYVVVIFCFLGELTSQLLLSQNGIPM
jgi:hypothetical protein